MKLYLLSQNENTGYDTYDSCVVCAENEDEAKSISPAGFDFTWASGSHNVICEEIGFANEDQKKGIIITSFNAG